MNKKLRYKILLGVLALVFTVCAAITVVASFIINKQNRDQVHTDLVKSMSVIQDSLVEKQIALSDVIFHMATMNKIGDDVKFLAGFKDSGLNMTRQSYEKIGNIITNTAIAENLWRIRVYTKEGELINYIERQSSESMVMGFQYNANFHYRSFKSGEQYSQIKFNEATAIEGITLSREYGVKIPEQKSVLFD